MYSSRFKEVKFFTFLPKNYHHQLKLPKKFVKNCLMNEFSEIRSSSTVSLKGPSGQTWAVELMRNDDSKLYLKKGWEIFVKAHNLKENDVLFFKYRSGVFDVLMFDDENFCEKESSYFVRNCQGCCHRSNGGLNERLRPRRSEEVESEPSIEIIEPKRLRFREKPITINDEDDEEEDADRETPRLPGRVPVLESEVNQVNPLEIALKRRTVRAKESHLPYKQAVREGKRRGTPHFDAIAGNKLEVGKACLFEITTSASSSSGLLSRTPRSSITFRVSIFQNVV
ncbi:hypothetical protein MKX01_039523 [Papaver californicum]|nr:hypothetical protein MKX01_039523 [Papaver californicum]